MGNESSKESSPESKDSSASLSSRLKDRLHDHSIRRHLHLRHGQRGGSGSGSSTIRKLLDAEHFAGIALLTLRRAEMKFTDKWLACVSFGEQTFRTQISDNTDKPIWNSEKKLLLEKNGPHVARISVFETNKVSSNKLIGYCDINLLEFLTQGMNSETEILDLLDPSSSHLVVGKIYISCSVEDPVETEKGFARRILSIVDYNQDGKLSFAEFSDLINAFGNQLAEEKKEELFKAADKNGDGVVSMDELAALLAVQQEK